MATENTRLDEVIGDPIHEDVYRAVARFERATAALAAALEAHGRPLGDQVHAELGSTLESLLAALEDARIAHRRRAGLRLVAPSA